MSDADRRGLMIILDGLGDRPCDVLDGQTPLEAARTPWLDALVAQGQCGLVDPLWPSVPVDTHIGVGLLLGLAPDNAALLSRGPVEAAGAGVPLKPGDVALRCNFATLEKNGDGLLILDRRAGRIDSGTSELAAVLQEVDLGDGVSGSLYPATDHRAVLRLTGPGLSGAIGDTDPGSAGEASAWDAAQDDNTLAGETEPAGVAAVMVKPCRPLSENAEAVHTAGAVERFIRVAHERLSAHPINSIRIEAGLPAANGVITRGAGGVTLTSNFLRHLGVRSAVVTSEATVAGLGRLFQSTVDECDCGTSAAGNELGCLIDRTIAALDGHDLVFLHIKCPDICSHDRDPVGKRDVLQLIDSQLSCLPISSMVIGVTGDHSTDSSTGRHCGDPVPSVIRAPGGRRDERSTFGEMDCGHGAMGRISGTGFLCGILDGMGVLPNARPSDMAFYR